MRDYLMFRLYSPLAPWGTLAGAEHRPSDAHPTKSAIAGLLGAALGIRKDNASGQTALTAAFRLATRVDALGGLLRDFHTAEVPPASAGLCTTRSRELAVEDLETIISTREYRTDATYTIAISLTPGAPFTLAELEERLRAPVFTLYIGRKSCPLALPLDPRIVAATSLRDAFAAYPPATQFLAPILTPQAINLYWDPSEVSGYTPDYLITRRDLPLSRSRWQFLERQEHHGSIRRNPGGAA